MPKLLNYTTSVAAEKTLGEIKHLLATHGARRITADCDASGNSEAIMFGLPALQDRRCCPLRCNRTL